MSDVKIEDSATLGRGVRAPSATPTLAVGANYWPVLHQYPTASYRRFTMKATALSWKVPNLLY